MTAVGTRSRAGRPDDGGGAAGRSGFGGRLTYLLTSRFAGRFGGRLVGQLAGNLAGRVGALASLGVATVVVARVGGPALVGAFTLVRILPGLVCHLSNCGLPGAAPYFLAADRRDGAKVRPTLSALTAGGAVLAGLG